MEFTYLVSAMTKIRELLNAPLFWFVLLGSVLFVLDGVRQERAHNMITITEGDIQHIRDQWSAQTGKPIAPDMLDALTKEMIQERRLAREAVALGLDQEDVIIRRRLAQKLRFLTDGLADDIAPTDKDLEAFFEVHRDAYSDPARLSFRHIFFGTEGRRHKAASDAEAVLSELQRQCQPDTGWRSLGDPFMLGPVFEDRSTRELAQLFGTAFVERLTTHSTSGWRGPISSPFGWHLVSVDSLTLPGPAELDQVRDLVLYDYRMAQRQLAYEQYLADLANKYPVVLESDSQTRVIIQATNEAVAASAP